VLGSGRASPGRAAYGRPSTFAVTFFPARSRGPGLLSLQVTVDPSASLTGSAWEGMSGAVVFAADAHDGEQAAVGILRTPR
jgi:hypothetical protein